MKKEQLIKLRQIKVRKTIREAMKKLDDRMHELIMGKRTVTEFEGLWKIVQTNKNKKIIDVKEII